MKRFIIIVAIAATVSGLGIGFGVKKLFEAMGANVFLPSSIVEIYGFCLLVSFGLAMYWSIKYIIRKHRKEEKDKMRAEIMAEFGLTAK